MAPSTCCFCAHFNPAGAKFCNECASPLHLQPCRLCDAVNPRDEQGCYRCGAALQAAPVASETSPERIVAAADEMLAALQRELLATTAPDANASKEGVGISGNRVAAALAATEEQVAAPAATTHPEPALPATSIAVSPEDRQWRPEQRSRGVALAMAVALVVLPAAVYVMQDPARLDRWLGKSAAPARVEPATADAAPAAPTIAAPAETPATATTVGSAPAALPGDVTTAAQSAQNRAAGVDAEVPPSPPTEVAAPVAAPVESAPAAVDTPAPPVAGKPDREARAGQASRARSSAARARPRERVTKPRPQAPGKLSQRADPQSAGPGQAPYTEPCSDAVAALGLCNR